MRQIFESYGTEFIGLMLLLALFEVILVGANILGFYDFNALFLR